MDVADQILREIEEHGERSFIPVIGPKKGKIVDDAVRESDPKLILEVGTFIGYSAIRMARLLRDDGLIISVDVNEKYASIAKKNIERAGYSDRVRIVVGDAKSVIPRLEGSIDLVFLDAAKDEYLNYLKLVEDRLHSGSVIVADNAGVFADEMRDYLRYVRNPGKFKSRYHESTLEFNDDIKDGVEVTIRL